MGLQTDSPDTKRLTRAERTAVAVDALAAVGLIVLVVFFLVVGVQAQANPDAPHGGAFMFLGAIITGPLVLLFGLTAAAVARRWRVRWALQALSVLACVAVILMFFGLV